MKDLTNGWSNLSDEQINIIHPKNEKNDWKFELSSGYDGYRNIKTQRWIYASEFHKMFAEPTTQELLIEKYKERLTTLKTNRALSGNIDDESFDDLILTVAEFIRDLKTIK